MKGLLTIHLCSCPFHTAGRVVMLGIRWCCVWTGEIVLSCVRVCYERYTDRPLIGFMNKVILIHILITKLT